MMNQGWDQEMMDVIRPFWRGLANCYLEKDEIGCNAIKANRELGSVDPDYFHSMINASELGFCSPNKRSVPFWCLFSAESG